VPTDEITGAQYLNSAPKFSQNGGFSAPNYAFWTNIYRQENFSACPKFRQKCSPDSPLPRRHATGTATHLERELEDVPAEVESTVTHAVRDAQLTQTWQMIDDQRQPQVVTGHRVLLEVDDCLVLDLFLDVCIRADTPIIIYRPTSTTHSYSFYTARKSINQSIRDWPK